MADFGTCSSKFFGRGQGGEIQAKNNISEIASIKLAIKRIDILVICNSLKDGAIQNIKRRNIFALALCLKVVLSHGWFWHLLIQVLW